MMALYRWEMAFYHRHNSGDGDDVAVFDAIVVVNVKVTYLWTRK